MTIINLHAGAVGTGKTKNYIKPQIESVLTDKDSLVLQVVVSIKAQKEAHKDFPNAKIINCEDDRISSAVKEAYNCITNPHKSKRHVIITHAAFQRLTPVATMPLWTLFGDEALNVYRTVKYDNTIASEQLINQEDESMMDWSYLFEKGNETGFGYHEVLNKIDRTDPFLGDELMQLSDPNWKTEMHHLEYERFGKTRQSVEFLQVFDSSLLKSFKEVYWVGANIDNLMFGKWLQNEGFDVNVQVPFTKRSGTKIKLYTTTKSNSISLQQSNKNYLLDFRTDFNKAIGDSQALRLANSKNSKEVGGNYTRLKHNMHSINEYRNSHTAVLFESALNATHRFTNWLSLRFNISSQVVFDTRTVDVAYQLLGRTPYRNDDNKKEISMGVPCARTAKRLIELCLDSNDVEVITMQSTSTKPPAKTAAERKREQRERDKAAKQAALVADVFEDITVEQPIESIIESIEPVVEQKELTPQVEEITIQLTGLERLKQRKSMLESEGYTFNIVKQPAEIDNE